MRSVIVRRVATGAVLFAAMATPALAFAQGSGAAEPDGVVRALSYIGCALGIAGSSTGIGVVSAVVACVKLFYETP